MNLLIFLDLTYNPGKNFKFYSLQGQNFKIFLIFTYNQGKVFLTLPIARGGGAHVYLVSIGSSPPRQIGWIQLKSMVKSCQGSLKSRNQHNFENSEDDYANLWYIID